MRGGTLNAIATRASRGLMGSVALLGILLLAASGCTEVDDRLGNDILLGNQKMTMRVVTLTDKVDTYVCRVDSVPSSRMGYGYFGAVTDPMFGGRKNSMLLQFIPTAVPYADIEGFGFDPIVDSMCILLSLSNRRGDETVTQTYEVYDIKEASDGTLLSRDKAYYTNFPIADYRKNLLFTFDDARRSRTGLRAKLIPTEAGKKYLDSLTHLGWSDYISVDNFPKKFQGLYITPAAGSPTAAATYEAELASSGLVIYARNHDKLDPTAIYDTISAMYMFRDTDEYDSTTGTTSAWNNVSANLTTFDYAGTDFEGHINDTLPTSQTREKVYLQTMGGVGTYLRFSDTFVAELQALRLNDKGKDCDIEINQALMCISLQNGATAKLDASVPRIGSYFEIPVLMPIPDYQYIYERQRQQSESYNLPYGGYLNRSNSCYEFDIAAFVQQLVKKEGEVSNRNQAHTFHLGPDAYNTFAFGDSAMQGSKSSDKPITIRLTYTLIEKGGE